MQRGTGTMNLRVAAFPLPRGRVRGGLTARVVETLPAIERLRGEWQALERRSSQAALFQSADWCLQAARHLAGHRGARFRPLVVTVREGGELVALAPLRLDRVGPLSVAVEISAPFGQYGDILVADGVDGAAVAAAVLAALKEAGADALVLRRVREDSPVAGALLARGLAVGTPDAAPHVDLADHPDFAAYLKTVNSKTRKNLRNLRNRLARGGPVEHRVSDGPGLAEMAEQCFAGRLRMLEEQGLTSTAFLDGGFHAFLRRLVDAPAGDRPDMLATALVADGDPVSMQWGFLHRGRYYAYITARNPAHDAVSPGKLHLEDVLEALMERGVAVADMLAPAVPYKFTWTGSATVVTDIGVPIGRAGRLYLETWLRRVRPWLRERYLALPAGLRRAAQRLAAPRRGEGLARADDC